MRQASDEPLGDGINASGHDEGNRAGRLLRGPDHRAGPRRDDDVNFHADELAGELVEQFDIPFRRTVLDRDRLVLDPAQLAKTRKEGRALRRGHLAERSENEVPETGDRR